MSDIGFLLETLVNGNMINNQFSSSRRS